MYIVTFKNGISYEANHVEEYYDGTLWQLSMEISNIEDIGSLVDGLSADAISEISIAPEGKQPSVVTGYEAVAANRRFNVDAVSLRLTKTAV